MLETTVVLLYCSRRCPGDVSILLEFYLNARAVIDAQTVLGGCLLQVAVRTRKIQAIRLLLDHGCRSQCVRQIGQDRFPVDVGERGWHCEITVGVWCQVCKVVVLPDTSTMYFYYRR